MQYWEVLRLYDIQTVVENVSLVCLVPFDVLDFLPARQPATMSTAPASRQDILDRYSKLLEHHDVLMRTVPWRLRRGLQALLDFASDPRADVQVPNASPITKINISITLQGMCEVDELRAVLLLKNGMRTSSIRLSVTSSTSKRLPRDDKTTSNQEPALTSETDMFSFLRRQRREASNLNGEIILPPSVALQDVAGLVITHNLERLSYSFAPEEVAVARSLFGTAPPQLAEALRNAGIRRSVSKTYGPSELSRELGEIQVTAANATSASNIIVADARWSGGAPVGDSGLTVPATGMAPQLSFDSQMQIERTLQWVMRNTMSCTIQVAANLTAEERTVMLERYSVTPPIVDENGNIEEGVPLLSCITNNVLGFYGNAMVMPFQIPAKLAEQTKTDTAKLQRALKRFHTDSFDHPTSTVALPTRGVLGEAVLGRSPSAEKIDLTRFWNWQDSPGDEATAIGEITVPSSNMLEGVEAPSKLTSLSPIINNFSTQGPSADSSLATSIAGKAIELSKPFDVAALTNAGNLTTIGAKTLDTAESARKDALASATQLATKAMETAAALKTAKSNKDKEPEAPKDGEEKPKGGSGGGGETPPNPAPPSGTIKPPAAARPASLQIFFKKNEKDFNSASMETAEHKFKAQETALKDWVSAAIQAGAKKVFVLGYASPEGTDAINAKLIKDRADTIANQIKAEMDAKGHTASVIPGHGGGPTHGGTAVSPESEWPKARRADATIVE
jgi:outer membrane protein OmpA-like peptidoglycan-associated protein